MKLRLKREIFTENSTIGSLFVDGVFECFVLEDKDRGLYDYMPLSEIEKLKKKAETCIPYGTYKIVVTKSQRFSIHAGHDVYLPLLVNVKGYEGIRIHTGNKPADTEGCLLPAKNRGKDIVTQSTSAFVALNEKINTSLKTGEVWIEITK